MSGMSSVSLNYIPYAYSSRTKSQDLIRHAKKGRGIPHFYLNKYCLFFFFFKVGFYSNHQCDNVFLLILL